MKRILTIFLVGILLLPSLLACGTEPQATATVPETTPAAPEVPAIEIGESWASMEGMKVEVLANAWTADEAWIGLYVSWNDLSCGGKMTASPVYLQEKVDGVWKNAFTADSEEPKPLPCDVLSDYRHCIVILTGLFDCFKNGTYRLFIEIPKVEGSDFWVTDEEAWQEFAVTGMPSAKAEMPIPFEFKEIMVGGPDYEFDSMPTPGRFDVISNRTELVEFLAARTSRSPEDLGYDEAFFEDHFLVAALFVEGNSGNRNTVEYVKLRSDGRLCISTRLLPYADHSANCVVISWRLFIALPKVLGVEKKEEVILGYHYFRANIFSEDMPLLKEYVENNCKETK